MRLVLPYLWLTALAVSVGSLYGWRIAIAVVAAVWLLMPYRYPVRGER